MSTCKLLYVDIDYHFLVLNIFFIFKYAFNRLCQGYSKGMSMICVYKSCQGYAMGYTYANVNVNIDFATLNFLNIFNTFMPGLCQEYVNVFINHAKVIQRDTHMQP